MILSSLQYEWNSQIHLDPLYPTLHVNYQGSLSSSNPKFNRHNASTSYFFYQDFQVAALTNGSYTFTSASSIDTFGYLYQSSGYPSEILITSDDDSGGGGQFSFSPHLSAGESYRLLVTTFSPNVIGSFAIDASGPSALAMMVITPTTSTSVETTSKCV